MQKPSLEVYYERSNRVFFKSSYNEFTQLSDHFGLETQITLSNPKAYFLMTFSGFTPPFLLAVVFLVLDLLTIYAFWLFGKDELSSKF